MAASSYLLLQLDLEQKDMSKKIKLIINETSFQDGSGKSKKKKEKKSKKKKEKKKAKKEKKSAEAGDASSDSSEVGCTATEHSLTGINQ